MENTKTRNLGLLTLVFVVAGLVANIISNPFILMVLATIIGLGLSIKLRKEIKDYDYFIAAIFAGLACLNQAIYQKNPFWIFVFASTYIGYLGGVGALRLYLHTNKLISNKPLKSILIGLVVGLILGLINLGLVKLGTGAESFDFSFNLQNFISALMPGIYEEVGLRYLFYGAGIYLLGGEVNDKKQNILLYILMIIPHLISHGGVGLMEGLVLFVLFGLPMSLALRKIDLSTAIIIHTLVDFIRFAAGFM